MGGSGGANVTGGVSCVTSCLLSSLYFAGVLAAVVWFGGDLAAAGSRGTVALAGGALCALMCLFLLTAVGNLKQSLTPGATTGWVEGGVPSPRGRGLGARGSVTSLCPVLPPVSGCPGVFAFVCLGRCVRTGRWLVHALMQHHRLGGHPSRVFLCQVSSRRLIALALVSRGDVRTPMWCFHSMGGAAGVMYYLFAVSTSMYGRSRAS